MSDKRSFARIPAKAAGLPLTATDLRVMIALALFANRDGYAHASLSRIGKIARVDRRGVTRSVDRLQRLGLLEVTHVPRGDAWSNNQYRLLYEPLDDSVTPTPMHGVTPTPMPDEGMVSPQPLPGVTTTPMDRGWAVPQPIENTGSICPLTNKNTDVPTERPYQEKRVSKEEGYVETGPTQITERPCEIVSAPELAVLGKPNSAGPALTYPLGAQPPHCLWPMGTGCCRPAVPGKRMCTVHEARR